MMMKKFITLCVAAAFAVASAGVHAIMLVDSRSADPEDGATSAIYAKETLLKTDVQEPPGDTVYYDIERRHYVSGPTTIYRGTTTANDAYVVSYTLEGMVFSEVPRAHAIQIQAADGAIDEIASDTDRTLTISLGGGPGDGYVVFTANNLVIVREPGVSGSADPADDRDPRNPIIVLDAKFSISGEGEGSITRVVQNRALRDIGIPQWTETHKLPGAIQALSALSESITPASTDPIAQAAFDFKQFKEGREVDPNVSASLGTVMLGVVGGGATTTVENGDDVITYTGDNYLNAQAPNLPASPDADAMDADVIDELAEILGEGTAGDAEKNGVTFSGNFTFEAVSKVTVGCTGGDIRKPTEDDADVYTDESKPQRASDFTSPMSLCIHVDGENEIPETNPYEVTTEYTGLDDAAFPPVGGEYQLAKIVHDGTTYYIPYLTTYHAYNQRFSIVNRGPATTYVFKGIETPSSDGSSWDPGTTMSGPLPTGQTILRTNDIVTITDGNRASGNLTIVADPADISATVQQVEKTSGMVDTVYLEHKRY